MSHAFIRDPSSVGGFQSLPVPVSAAADSWMARQLTGVANGGQCAPPMMPTVGAVLWKVATVAWLRNRKAAALSFRPRGEAMDLGRVAELVAHQLSLCLGRGDRERALPPQEVTRSREKEKKDRTPVGAVPGIAGG